MTSDTKTADAPDAHKLKNNDSAKAMKLVTLLSSWAIVFIIGIAICVLAVLITSGFSYVITLDSEDSFGLYLILYSLAASVPIWWLHLVANKFKRKLFFRFADIALLIGLALNIIIGIVGVAMITHAGLKLSTASTASSGNVCYDTAAEQVNTAGLSATFPLATDNNQSGTGFAVSKDGKILTAYHVIENAKEVYVNTTEGKQPLRVVDSAPEYDLALLQSNEQYEYHLHLTEKHDITDEVFAIGYPGNTFSAGQASVSKGIIARLVKPSDLKLNGHSNTGSLSFVQTDAAINGGNSGGPLVGKCGVVGVVNMKSDRMQLQEYGVVSEEGIGFAISSKTIAGRFDIPISK